MNLNGRWRQWQLVDYKQVPHGEDSTGRYCVSSVQFMKLDIESGRQDEALTESQPFTM